MFSGISRAHAPGRQPSRRVQRRRLRDMLTLHRFADIQTRFWYRGFVGLLLCFVFYCAWAIDVVVGQGAMNSRQANAELDKALMGAVVIAIGLLTIGFKQYYSQKKEIERRVNAEHCARHLAHHDALTSLPNRRLFDDHLGGVIKALPPRGPTHAVLMLDLNGFKQINDVYGHDVGDQLLKILAQRMLSWARRGDIVARFGGDEFAVLALDVADAENAGRIASGLIGILEDPVEAGGVCHSIGACVGIALMPDDALAGDDLLRLADIALYRAKFEGGSRVRLFEASMEEQLVARQALKQDLETAIEEGEFRLFYQPLVDLESNKICSCEALLRWQHPTLGLIAPSEFIPLAEETGQILRIGEWALAKACHDAAAWPQEISVAVNVSPIQFRNAMLPQVIARSLEASGLRPARLTVEITESLLLQENAANLELLERIKRLGVAVALDDFGTGFSSLSYLRSFPFDKVKVDRSFIESIGSSKHAEAITHAVGGLLRSLDMIMTAEGVETNEQLRWLKAEGCNEVQGYLFGRPVAQEQLSFLRYLNVG
ncbi:MAG: hypothetical protein JWM58_3137 [Rhizobium sp.]|nr:hypothetical protein [Rhizobium sp.]